MATMTSKINPKFHMDQNNSVVSLLNTGSAWTGHAVIIVEGMTKEGSLFVGQYELRAKMLKSSGTQTMMDVLQGSTGNNQGYIGELRVIETDRYTHPKDLSEFSSKSWFVRPEYVQKMIDAIKKEYDELEEAKAERRELPPYQSAGSYRTRALGGNGGENCLTWAENRLRIAMINPINSWFDWIKALPELHVDSKNCQIQ